MIMQTLKQSSWVRRFATYYFRVWLHLILLILQWACGTSDREYNQALDSVRTPKKVQPEKRVIYFGVISRYNPRIMLEEYQPIMDYLTENTSYRFELKLGKSYEDAVQYLCNGDVQIASLGGVTYLQAHKQCGAVPIVRPVNKDGRPFYRSITVVRNDSPLQELSDLHGRSIAFAAIHSTSGNLIPRYYLAKAGIRLQELSNYQNLKHHDSVIKAVLTGRFDAGTVKDNIAYRYLKKGLRILYVSKPIPSVPIVVPSDCDPALVSSVKTALLKISPNDPAQERYLSTWNNEFRYGFVEASDTDYDGLRQMIRTIPQHCSVPCHSEIR